MIDDYYEKIRQGKQEKLFHEVIFQIGNKDDMNAKSEEGLLAKKILTEFMDEFQARNPNLYVFSTHLHMDEETPHLHIDFRLVRFCTSYTALSLPAHPISFQDLSLSLGISLPALAENTS